MMEFLYVYDTRGTYQYSAGILVLTQKNILRPVFELDVITIPPRSGDLRNTRFVFSWSHLDQVEK